MSFDYANKCIVVSVQDCVLCSQNERLRFLCDLDIRGYNQKIILLYIGMKGHKLVVSICVLKGSSNCSTRCQHAHRAMT